MKASLRRDTDASRSAELRTAGPRASFDAVLGAADWDTADVSGS
ncbi:MAG: hypothetical protein NTV23_04435 [Propionibacteriales bacterium]|nr:hypothetical protein [Propionibacteriales bacterium]